ncbi:hypothetical protein FDENT_2585 [Fusarium denticulatum]|uniref:Uncharacterized protein n=1 Tax=Fusarium denticulatum TaxID=48507 RepID=A0A8H5XFK2_9HYPO|nr:hypothetical protein FDENT_2585 [Fusarium denticulatum]
METFIFLRQLSLTPTVLQPDKLDLNGSSGQEALVVESLDMGLDPVDDLLGEVSAGSRIADTCFDSVELLRRALGPEKARRHSHATTYYSYSSYIGTCTGLEDQEDLICLQADRHKGEYGGTAGDYNDPKGPDGQCRKYIHFKPDTVISESGGYPYFVHNTWYLSEADRLITQDPQLRGGYVAAVRNSNNITFGTPARIPTPVGPEALYCQKHSNYICSGLHSLRPRPGDNSSGSGMTTFIQCMYCIALGHNPLD